MSAQTALWHSIFTVFINCLPDHSENYFLKHQVFIFLLESWVSWRVLPPFNILIYRLFQVKPAHTSYGLSQRSTISSLLLTLFFYKNLFCAPWLWFLFCSRKIWKIVSQPSSALSMGWGKRHVYSRDAILTQWLITANLPFKLVLLKKSALTKLLILTPGPTPPIGPAGPTSP